MVNRRAVAAASVAVLGPLLAVLAIQQPHDSSGRTGCAVRYTGTPAGLRLTVTLEQPGSLEVRAGGRVIARQNEPAGDSSLTAQATGVPAVTEFTADGQLLACVVAPG